MSRAGLLAVGMLATGVAAVVAAAWLASPNPTALRSRVASRLAATRGRAVSADAVAPSMREAVVATEDERFYRHDGIDVIGVLRALPYDVTHLSLAQGASTITEQVAKLLYLNGNDHDPWRKLEDASVALKLESRYSKDEILAAYLDSAYFGEGAYGVWQASRLYFGVAPARLDVAQASLLAGLIQAPSAYDPRRHPELARARQAEVLRSLVRDGFVTGAEAAAAIGRPLRLRGGAALPPLRGVDLAAGPAFRWLQLALGALLVLAAAAALALVRRRRLESALGLIALRACVLVLLVAGAAVAIRAFRTA